MSVKISLLNELKAESATTLKVLERVPFEKADYTPHEKSSTLARLATHITETTCWVYRILEANEFDFSASAFTPKTASSTAELLDIFHTQLNKALAALEAAHEADLSQTWTMKHGTHIVATMSKQAAIRRIGISHLIHHRGQLSVYLRMLNIPLPGIYGPSADEK
ncbi:MAG: DinB family protein [Bacteroidetes bacterium]|nr:DinB family protein [Bacteroidota bacterium]